MTQPSEFQLTTALRQELRDFADDEEVSPKDCLSLAAQLVRLAHAQLDTRSAPCRACGLNHFSNYQHAKAAEKTKGLLTKLRHLIDEDPWTTDTE